MHANRSNIAKAIALITASLAIAAPAQAGATSCANTDIVPSPANVSQVDKALTCLVNEQRTNAGVPKLRTKASIARVAQSYAAQMGREHFFSHTAPNGATQTTRLKATGYFNGARKWYIGENIFEAPTGSDTPAMILDNWMHSAGHRANIMNRKLKDFGVGHILTTPTGELGTTAVALFGGR